MSGLRAKQGDITKEHIESQAQIDEKEQIITEMKYKLSDCECIVQELKAELQNQLEQQASLEDEFSVLKNQNRKMRENQDRVQQED